MKVRFFVIQKRISGRTQYWGHSRGQTGWTGLGEATQYATKGDAEDDQSMSFTGGSIIPKSVER